ncbi:NUDIX hydrolase [Patescibacteria group bacterium]
MHFSVGAVIEKDCKYLLIDREIKPLGFAGLAGHINEGETPEQTLIRKVEEESGLQVVDYNLLFEEEVEWNWCHAGIQSHYWYLYSCEVKGVIKNNKIASKSIGWYSPQKISNLELEPVWQYWLEKLNIL